MSKLSEKLTPFMSELGSAPSPPILLFQKAFVAADAFGAGDLHSTAVHPVVGWTLESPIDEVQVPPAVQVRL